MKPFAETKAKVATVLANFGSSGLYTHADAAYGRLGSGLLTTSRWAADQRSIYDLASLTKALVTTPLAFQAAEGNFELRLRDLFRCPPPGIREEVLGLTLRQILRHETGLPAWRNFFVDMLGPDTPVPNLEQRHHLIGKVFARSVYPVISDHARPLYSDIGFIALGMALEDYYGKNLGHQLSELCQTIGFAPLVHFGYGPLANMDLVVSTGYCRIRERILSGEVWDENCAALGGVTGHAGLFGTISDLSQYLECLLASDLGRDLMDRNYAEVTPGGESLLGWRQGADPSAAGFGNGHAIGHLGFTGTAFWLDRDGSYAILLTNRVISGRVNPQVRHLRRQIFDIYGKI